MAIINHANTTTDAIITYKLSYIGTLSASLNVWVLICIDIQILPTWILIVIINIIRITSIFTSSTSILTCYTTPLIQCCNSIWVFGFFTGITIYFSFTLVITCIAPWKTLFTYFIIQQCIASWTYITSESPSASCTIVYTHWTCIKFEVISWFTDDTWINHILSNIKNMTVIIIPLIITEFWTTRTHLHFKWDDNIPNGTGCGCSNSLLHKV